MLVKDLIEDFDPYTNIVISENDGDTTDPLCSCKVETSFTLSDFILDELIDYVEVPEENTLIIWLADSRVNIQNLLIKKRREDIINGKET